MADSKKVHWTQTPEGKEKLSKAMKVAHSKTKEVKRKYSPRTTKKDVAALVINGWRVTLGKDAIKIERE